MSEGCGGILKLAEVPCSQTCWCTWYSRTPPSVELPRRTGPCIAGGTTFSTHHIWYTEGSGLGASCTCRRTPMSKKPALKPSAAGYSWLVWSRSGYQYYLIHRIPRSYTLCTARQCSQRTLCHDGSSGRPRCHQWSARPLSICSASWNPDQTSCST